MDKKSSNLSCPHCGFVFPPEFQPTGIHHCPTCQRPLSLRPTKFSKGADNIHHESGCPPVMSDGRFMRDFVSGRELTDRIARARGLESSAQIREFIQENADELILADRRRLFGANETNPSFGCSDSWDLWQKRLEQMASSSGCRRAIPRAPQE